MNNYSNHNTARRYMAYVDSIGITQIHFRNPYIVAWWNAAFPGFGYLAISKYIPGIILFIWEIVININANLNEAIVYSFQGKIHMAASILNTKLLLSYTPVYFFGIWHSYRATIEMNQVYILANQEAHRFNSFHIGAFGIHYLDKKNPFFSLLWSFLIPGLGQLYIHRLFVAFISLFSAIVLFYLSGFIEGMTLLLVGEIQQATAVLQPEWLLFLPSIYGFSMYDAYVNAVDINKLFDKEQRLFLQDHYQNPNYRIVKGKKVN